MLFRGPQAPPTPLANWTFETKEPEKAQEEDARVIKPELYSLLGKHDIDTVKLESSLARLSKTSRISKPKIVDAHPVTALAKDDKLAEKRRQPFLFALIA